MKRTSVCSRARRPGPPNYSSERRSGAGRPLRLRRCRNYGRSVAFCPGAPVRLCALLEAYAVPAPIALLGREFWRRGASVVLSRGGPPKHTFGEPGVRGAEFRGVSFLGSDCPGRCRRLGFVKGVR